MDGLLGEGQSSAADLALDRFRRNFDPQAALFAGDPASLPAHWRGYADARQAERLACLRAEMAGLRDYLPETADHLAGAAEAVILTTRRTGPLRVLMRETAGVLYPTWSAAPLGAAMPANPAAAALIADGPPVLQWLYRHWMDGLTDIWEFGGLLNSRAITSMAEDGDVFGEMDWYDDLDHHHDLNRWIRIFSSGGGGYLLVDLDDPALRGDDPEAIQVLVKEAESLHRVPLFAYLDGWSAIAMGADDPA